jgi:hypothetical protein
LVPLIFKALQNGRPNLSTFDQPNPSGWLRQSAVRGGPSPRAVRGAISFNSSIHLPPIAGSLPVKPVMLPPGCANLDKDIVIRHRRLRHVAKPQGSLLLVSIEDEGFHEFLLSAGSLNAGSGMQPLRTPM